MIGTQTGRLRQENTTAWRAAFDERDRRRQAEIDLRFWRTFALVVLTMTIVREGLRWWYGLL